MGRNRRKGAGGGAGAVAEPAYSSASIPKGWNPADGDVGISKDVNGLRVSIVPQGFERRGGRAYYSLELAGDENAPRFNIVLSQNTDDTWDQLTTRAKPVVDLLKDVTSDENSDFTILPDGSFMIVNYNDDVRLDVYPDGTWNSNNFEIDSDGTTYNAGGRRGQGANPLEGLRQGLENYGEMVEGKFLSRAGIAQNVENIVGGSNSASILTKPVPNARTFDKEIRKSENDIAKYVTNMVNLTTAFTRRGQSGVTRLGQKLAMAIATRARTSALQELARRVTDLQTAIRDNTILMDNSNNDAIVLPQGRQEYQANLQQKNAELTAQLDRTTKYFNMLKIQPIADDYEYSEARRMVRNMYDNATRTIGRNGANKPDVTSRAIKDMLQFNTKKLILPENMRISPIPGDDW